MKSLKQLEAELRRHWENNLKNKGVKWPSHKKLIELCCLYEHMPNPISQDQMLEWHENHGLKYGRQARHLAREERWDVRTGHSRSTRMVVDKSMKGNELRLHSVKEPNPIADKNQKTRVNLLNAKDWEEILETFKDRGCGVCGTKHKNYDKGHLNREKELKPDNIVPMCPSCNNWGQFYDLDFKVTAGLIVRPILKNRKGG